MKSTNLSVYMFNMLYSYFQDNEQTPHIWVREEGIDNPVIRGFAKGGMVCLNLGPHACQVTVRDWGLDFHGAFQRRKQAAMLKWEDILLIGGRPGECLMPPLLFSATEYPDFVNYTTEAVAEPAFIPKPESRPKFGLIQGGKE